MVLSETGEGAPKGRVWRYDRSEATRKCSLLIAYAPHILENGMPRGAGLRWRPLPQAEAPTEPTGETIPYGVLSILIEGR